MFKFTYSESSVEVVFIGNSTNRLYFLIVLEVDKLLFSTRPWVMSQLSENGNITMAGVCFTIIDGSSQEGKITFMHSTGDYRP